MHSELWARTWQVVTLGMISTFAFTGLLVLSLVVMRARKNRGAEISNQSGKTEKE